jgi:hypothetical protein
MIPNIDLQLSAVIKALRDVVAPATDPNNKLAMEQLHLSIATLQLVQTWVPMEHRRARQELSNAMNLGQMVGEAGAKASLGSILGCACEILDDTSADTATLDGIRLLLLSNVEAAVAEASSGASETAIARAVIAGSRPQLDLARAFCRPAGFDGPADGSPTPAQLLSELKG